jgi:hypothetical protein
VVLPVLLLQLALFNLAEEIGWTGSCRQGCRTATAP